MHIELVDALRCPFPHEETWLVAAVTRFDGRDIAEGALGCPICRRQFVVRFGEVDFSGEASAPDAPRASRVLDEPTIPAEPADRAVGATAVPAVPAVSDAVATEVDGTGDADAADAIYRARALLGLEEGGGTILVGGALARHADALADAVPVMALLLNAPAGSASRGRPPSAMRAAGGVPLAAGSLRVAWLDDTTARAPWLEGVVRALRPGGRLVAPAGAIVPAGIRELARDAREWVGERDAAVAAASAPIILRRR
jgi:hypothetical protein